MKKMILHSAILFFVLLAGTFLYQEIFQVQLGNTDYFLNHGFLLLIGLALFPRLILLFSSIESTGLLWWVGWIFYPRLLIAFLATINYFRTNPVLVIVSWLVALSGESAEKFGVGRNVHVGWMERGQRHSNPQGRARNRDDHQDVVDVEFREL